jgi:hypothetical protein
MSKLKRTVPRLRQCRSGISKPGTIFGGALSGSQTGTGDQTQHHQGQKYSAGVEFEGLRSAVAQRYQNQRADATCKEQTGSASTGPLDLSGHLVAVNTGDHRDDSPQQIHQDSSGGTAVLRRSKYRPA